MVRVEEELLQQHLYRSDKERLLVTILRTSAWIGEQFQRVLEPYSITQQQYNVLRILRGSKEPLSTCDIRRRMIDRASDTSRIVDRLIEKGLAQKTPSSVDRRRIEVHITEQGRKLLETLDPVVRRFHRLADVLTQAERMVVVELLDRLRSQSDADH
ncbi:MAG: MarR family transcriptional regulator [Bacteroidota bacterium]|nr:MarR family transcriptional regulator [Candidatus Kapabacteria bacterium]MCX7937402.1 MarR family transcriptional regulator [Chlorobiota bacterium]MDW8075670.1 MarR family transcriptional regulator [Bacteroidota bacterium]MDW8272273.1 MarR family transcriptional regulator [Bacteroidota bacterium]